MRQKINYGGPWITRAEEEAVLDAVRNGFYENYRTHVGRLEARLCEVLGVKHALAVNSGTASIHLALAALQLEPGSEVITTDSSCVASGMPINYCGLHGVFVDVARDTWCMSPEAVREAITPKTRAILVVHWNGHPAAMDEIMVIADEHDLKVIEDGAPSLGAEYKGRKVGTIGDVGCFSFQGAKVAIAGHGGAIVTDNTELYELACSLSAYGRTDSVMQYWSDYVGFNYGMPNLPAALATAQVDRLDELIAKKRQIFAWYREGLGGFENVRLVAEAEGTRSTYCYPVMEILPHVKRSRAEIFHRLREDNIDARPAQPRISQMPMFEARFPNPECETVETRGVVLPSAFNLEEDDVAFVCERLRDLAN